MYIKYYLTVIVFCVLTSLNAKSTSHLGKTIDEILVELQEEVLNEKINYDRLNKPILDSLNSIRGLLKQNMSSENHVDLLIIKIFLEDKIKLNNALYRLGIDKIKYLKGIEIIKILHDKVLALDHHFATVSTLNEINKIANPNQYEDFRNVKEMLGDRNDKKTGFNLSSILGNNIYTSVVHSFVSLFTNNQTTKQEKEHNLKNIECILDFTLRMHNDLTTIYFETAFLQKSNESIMTELEQLFKDYTQPIQYKTALKECRENDDWNVIRDDLNTYLETLQGTIKSGDKPSNVRTMQINLQFPIDRLLQFITQYNAFIDQGSKFYEKFGIMLNSYENEQQCANKIPVAYQTMKKNIALSIEKFNTAYKPIEINGSKLKQLLYGISEYD